MCFKKKTFCFLFLFFFGAQKIYGQQSMYVLCPPQFIPIGNDCYLISQDRVNWLDAHFNCKERNSRLAEPTRKEDRFLRKHLNKVIGSQFSNMNDMWIGARFNWERNKWQWGYNGEDLTYQSFSQMSTDNKDLTFHCAILKPVYKYRWSASSCEQQLQYVCQHKMKVVNDRKRHEVYSKWNETYPNEKANEVVRVMSKNDLMILKGERFGPAKRTRIANRSDYLLKDFVRKKPMKNSRRGLNKQFELNRYRAQGIRHAIHFDSTKQQNHNNRQWRHKQRWLKHSINTQLPSIMTNYSSVATTAAPKSLTKTVPTTIMTTSTRPTVPSTARSITKNRVDEQYVEKNRDVLRKFQNNLVSFEILDNANISTLSPIEVKKKKLKDVREKLSRLSPREQNEFYKRRAERNKKRGISVVNTI